VIGAYRPITPFGTELGVDISTGGIGTTLRQLVGLDDLFLRVSWTR
jgi:hypothetical protein